MKINKEHFRKDINDFFRLSGTLEAGKLKHNPFIVLTDEGKGVELCRNAGDLIKDYSDETEVIAQWRGEWSSDFFTFTVLDVKEYMLII